MNRWVLAVAGTAALFGVGAMWVMRPIPEPIAEVPAPPVVVEVAPASLPPARTPVPYAVGPDGKLGPVPRPTPVSPASDFRNQVQPADAKGVTTAAIARRTEIASCVQRYWESAGERGFEGRLILEITVEGEGLPADTQILNGPAEPSVEACVAGVMADARFEATPHPVRVRWPVPIEEPF